MRANERRALIRNAKKGLIRKDVLEEFNKLSEAKRKKLVSSHNRPILLEMSPGDVHKIVINPALPMNQFFSFLVEKFGRELGLKLLSCFMFSNLKGKEQEKWIRRSDRVRKELSKKAKG
jgi:hypothetical protein